VELFQTAHPSFHTQFCFLKFPYFYQMAKQVPIEKNKVRIK
jgi:hypothetical protein